MLFDENYNLAATQSLKNKDIPEGGAKGTILPSLGANPRRCFEKYVDVSFYNTEEYFLSHNLLNRPLSILSYQDRLLVLKNLSLICMASLSCCSSVPMKVLLI